MARPGATIAKREKEKARQQKTADRAARKAETRERRSVGRDASEGEDPDIAGIVPGPQPLPSEFDDVVL